MSVKLPSLDKQNLRESFFELLQDFPTYPAARNFFLVKLNSLPAALTDANQKSLGITRNSPGIDKAKSVYEKYITGNEYMYLATGIDLTTETLGVENKGQYPNGLLPVGPFMEQREYPDNDLDIAFSESNISFIDTIIRPWIQLYSVHGNFDDLDLTTDVDIYFIAKEQLTTRKKTFGSVLFGTSGGSPVVRKIYKYRDCIPYNIVDASVAQYESEQDIGSVAVKWRFSTYDVITPIDGQL
mgnify:CR=1 FL=1|tara:strand:+ start:389 stop:1111 length:723 start_codon:yes stop_codon:yes gene_type:complete